MLNLGMLYFNSDRGLTVPDVLNPIIVAKNPQSLGYRLVDAAGTNFNRMFNFLKLLYLFSYICLAVDDDGVSDQAAMHAARHLKEYIRRELGHLAETTRHKIVCAATPPGFTASRLADREQGEGERRAAPARGATPAAKPSRRWLQVPGVRGRISPDASAVRPRPDCVVALQSERTPACRGS